MGACSVERAGSICPPRVGRCATASLVARGKSEDEVVAAKVTADLDAKIQEVGTTNERFVRQVYAELKSAR